MTVVRRAAWSTEAGQAGGWPTSLTWYAVAIREMKKLTPRLEEFSPLAMEANALGNRERPTRADQQRYRDLVQAMTPILQGWSDPRGLGYQSQVHDSFLPPRAWPRHGGALVIWSECAHGNWFFLPWHRAYLLEFEQVARAHVVRLGGPADWALPYWNSSDYRRDPQAASLPLAVRDPLLPDGLDLATENGQPDPDRGNPLYEPSRIGPEDLLGPPSAEDWCDASGALTRHHYANSEDTQRISFAGGYLEDLTQFHFSGEMGQVDAQPHGLGHTHTGGLMAAFSTAGLDPLFWMHHANVDRLWETYAHDLGHGYPFPDGRPAQPGLNQEAYDSWAGREFRFLRADGAVGTWKAPGVTDTKALGYEYDTVARPVFNDLMWVPSGQDVDAFGVVRGRRRFTAVAAAIDVRISQRVTVLLTSGEPGEDGSGLVGPTTLWNVRFDGLRCHAPAQTSYAVYIDLDDGVERDPARLIGVLSLFGVFEASLEANGDVGRTRLLEATGVVRALPSFDPFSARLTLIPANPDRDLAAVALTAERISLEVAE
jgi:tyrosinase